MTGLPGPISCFEQDSRNVVTISSISSSSFHNTLNTLIRRRRRRGSCDGGVLSVASGARIDFPCRVHRQRTSHLCSNLSLFSSLLLHHTCHGLRFDSSSLHSRSIHHHLLFSHTHHDVPLSTFQRDVLQRQVSHVCLHSHRDS